MTLIVDADGCPVVDITVRLAAEHELKCVLVCDCCHIFEKDWAQTITVEKGSDSADFKIANIVCAGDVVITQDYGLATMCLARKTIVINQNGMVYDNDNIDSLLYSRYTAKKLRNSGVRLKGPSKRTREQDEKFKAALLAILHKNIK